MARILWMAALVGLLIVSAGCRSTSQRHPWCRRDAAPAARPGFVPPPPPTACAPLPPSGVLPAQAHFPTVPGGAVMTPPPGATVLPPGAPTAPPGPPPLSAPNMPPARIESRWQATEPREPAAAREPAAREPAAREPAAREPALREPALREPAGPRDSPPNIRLYAPEPIERETPEAPPARKPGVSPAFPAIAEFSEVKPGVYAGRRPPIDGLDWLQAAGVQTVVNVRLFGEDDSTDRRQVEARKMRYVAFEVSPQTLTKERMEDFLRLVRDGSVFVYDENGALAGSMWYLYHRFGELHDDDTAQLRARRQGLQTDREGPHRDMWLAVQRLAGDNGR